MHTHTPTHIHTYIHTHSFSGNGYRWGGRILELFIFRYPESGFIRKWTGILVILGHKVLLKKQENKSNRTVYREKLKDLCFQSHPHFKERIPLPKLTGLSGNKLPTGHISSCTILITDIFPKHPRKPKRYSSSRAISAHLPE